MIPYPNENPNTPFGEINGVQPVLSGNVQAAAKGRLSVVEWYINEVLDRWEKAGFENLRLIGLYWNAESIDTTGIDGRYLPEVGKMVREHGLKFYWIPWYKAPGYSQWKDLGFDAVMLQPNYMFDHDISRTRLITAASEARKYGLGMEIKQIALSSLLKAGTLPRLPQSCQLLRLCFRGSEGVLSGDKPPCKCSA